MRIIFKLITAGLSLILGGLLLILLAPLSMFPAVILASIFAIFAILALFVTMSKAITILLAIFAVIGWCVILI